MLLIEDDVNLKEFRIVITGLSNIDLEDMQQK